MSRHRIKDPEVCSGAIRQVAHHQPIRLSAVLVHNDDVCHIVATACVHQLGQHQATAVHAAGVGKHKLQLLRKLHQSGAGVPRRGDQHLRIHLARMGVFVVDVGAGHGGVVILQLHLPPQLRLLPPQLRRQRLPLLKRLPDFALVLVLHSLLALQALSVQVFSPQPRIAANHYASAADCNPALARGAAVTATAAAAAAATGSSCAVSLLPSGLTEPNVYAGRSTLIQRFQ
mmetsp:Transcript_16093/g.48205  ORF Transcript_16093/g.48205 Transcript_16093/m.48205 type:complete len:230 (-) Transcript_16093:228-917(-)